MNKELKTSGAVKNESERYYGALPAIVGEFPIDFSEICFYQYMPIKMLFNSGRFDDRNIRVEPRLACFLPLIEAAYEDAGKLTPEPYDYKKDLHIGYVYLTVKHVHVTPEYWGNRPGWHTDGFGSEDINYIWYDKNPTIFSCIPYSNISDDCIQSMIDFEEQFNHWDNHCKIVDFERTYPVNALLRLDQFVVHKVAPVTESGFRTFVKITFSKNRYNLKGNTHNYLFDYKWEMKERNKTRNHPTK